MQFTERFDLQRTEFLNQMTIDEFSRLVSPDKKKSDILKSYMILNTVCKQQIRAKGVVDRLFAHTMNTPGM